MITYPYPHMGISAFKMWAHMVWGRMHSRLRMLLELLLPISASRECPLGVDGFRLKLAPSSNNSTNSETNLQRQYAQKKEQTKSKVVCDTSLLGQASSSPHRRHPAR